LLTLASRACRHRITVSRLGPAPHAASLPWMLVNPMCSDHTSHEACQLTHRPCTPLRSPDFCAAPSSCPCASASLSPPPFDPSRCTFPSRPSPPIVVCAKALPPSPESSPCPFAVAWAVEWASSVCAAFVGCLAFFSGIKPTPCSGKPSGGRMYFEQKIQGLDKIDGMCGRRSRSSARPRCWDVRRSERSDSEVEVRVAVVCMSAAFVIGPLPAGGKDVHYQMAEVVGRSSPRRRVLLVDLRWYSSYPCAALRPSRAVYEPSTVHTPPSSAFEAQVPTCHPLRRSTQQAEPSFLCQHPPSLRTYVPELAQRPSRYSQPSALLAE
jgi:hypothetical protein